VSHDSCFYVLINREYKDTPLFKISEECGSILHFFHAAADISLIFSLPCVMCCVLTIVDVMVQ
jgi:hypothetical protein